MKKAFTLIELVVAVALLAIVFLFAGTIFKVCINSYRTAVANAEIIQKLRAITDQLNADFKGIRTDAPLLFWFYEDNSLTDPNRYDQIMFFADGDFQSTQLYESGSNAEPAPDGSKLVVGNIARIFYGQAQSRDPADDTMKDPFDLKKEDRLLAKRQHILTADTELAEYDMTNFDIGIGADKLNERYEHDSLSLAQWKLVGGSDYDTKIIPTCFDNPDSRPYIDMDDPNTFQKLMCEGVGSFAIQWAYWNPDSDPKADELRWFPSNDPNDDGSDADSHFLLICSVCDKFFGVSFNIPAPAISRNRWHLVESLEYRSGVSFPADFYPKAIKFTFTLYDSRGVIKEGREFTHIVYIGD